MFASPEGSLFFPLEADFVQCWCLSPPENILILQEDLSSRCTGTADILVRKHENFLFWGELRLGDCVSPSFG